MCIHEQIGMCVHTYVCLHMYIYTHLYVHSDTHIYTYMHSGTYCYGRIQLSISGKGQSNLMLGSRHVIFFQFFNICLWLR